MDSKQITLMDAGSARRVIDIPISRGIKLMVTMAASDTKGHSRKRRRRFIERSRSRWLLLLLLLGVVKLHSSAIRRLVWLRRAGNTRRARGVDWM